MPKPSKVRSQMRSIDRCILVICKRPRIEASKVMQAVNIFTNFLQPGNGAQLARSASLSILIEYGLFVCLSVCLSDRTYEYSSWTAKDVTAKFAQQLRVLPGSVTFKFFFRSDRYSGHQWPKSGHCPEKCWKIAVFFVKLRRLYTKFGVRMLIRGEYR